MKLREANSLSPKQIGKLLPWFKLIRNWMGKVESYAMELLRKGEDLGGAYIAEGRSNRCWRNPDQAERFLKKSGLKSDDIYKKTLITPAQAEIRLGRENENLQKLIKKPSGAPALALPGDKRPALDLSTVSDFEEIDD